MRDEVGKFYVVTTPTQNSELLDVVFEVDVKGMMRQTLGGLRQDEIEGIFKNKQKAESLGKKLLKER